MGDMWILFPVLWRVFARLVRYLRRGIFLVPVAAIGMALFGVHPWTIAMVVLALFVALWRPVIAAALLPAAMVVAGVSGLVVAATEPGTGFWRVPALDMLRQRLVKSPPRHPPVPTAVARAIVQGRRVVISARHRGRAIPGRRGPAGGVVPGAGRPGRRGPAGELVCGAETPGRGGRAGELVSGAGRPGQARSWQARGAGSRSACPPRGPGRRR